MRLLADENFPGKAVVALREMGHDVSWVKEDAPSTEDRKVLRRAMRERRILLTLDKDFGELAFRSRLPASCGVVLFRVPPIPDLVTSIVERVLTSQADFRNRFVVVETSRLRERPLPPRDHRH